MGTYFPSYREDLDEMPFDVCPPSLRNEKRKVLTAMCHPEAPVWVEYEDGVFTIVCSMCGDDAIHVAVESRPEDS